MGVERNRFAVALNLAIIIKLGGYQLFNRGDMQVPHFSIDFEQETGILLSYCKTLYNLIDEDNDLLMIFLR